MSPSPDPSRMKGDLERLVAFKTENPLGGESQAAGFLADLLSAEGLEADLHEYRPGRTNVVARLDDGAGPVFAFNTHIDVDPAGEGWTGDPFRLRESGGNLYGRGACDAKGALIAMVEAIRLLRADRSSWSGTVLGVFVADEEVASEGAKAYAAARPRIDYAVIGEPTSNGTVVAHKGDPWAFGAFGNPRSRRKCDLSGRTFIALVEAHHLSVIRHRAHPLVGNASLTVTRVHGGVADNDIPDRCDPLLDRRIVPGEDESVVKVELAALLDRRERRLL